MNNVNVSLDCRNDQYDVPAGYKTIESSIGTTYSFKYTGGSDGEGGVTQITGSPTATITVSVGGDPRYTIRTIEFGGSDITDLSWAPGPTANVAVITDTNTEDLDDYYGVTVYDSVAKCTFVCDPPIRNEPPA